MRTLVSRLPRLLLPGLAALIAATAFAQPRKVTLSVKTLIDRDPVVAGGPVHVALEVQVPKKFHINAHAPLEPHLIPTVLTFDLPGGVTVEEIAYPEPEMVKTGGAPAPVAVYGGRFLIGVALEVAPTVGPGEVTLDGHLRYQACDDHVCFFPATQDVRVVLPVVPAGVPFSSRHEEVFGRIRFANASSVSGGERGDGRADEGSPADAKKEGADSVLALLEEFEILGTAGGNLGAGSFLEFIASAEKGGGRAEPEGALAGRGPLALLVLILLGGLALNLTPCVLPLVPINLAIIGAGTEANNRAQGFALGGTYGLGMALAYGLLGLVVILTSSTFGALNASPWFNVAIAVLFVVLSLAMFDVITIDFSRLQAKVDLGTKSKGSFVVAFTMGAVAALLAGACVAPVVIQVIVLSSDLFAKGHRVALALPFVLGIGMALPWPFAGAGLSALPRPGAWMTRVKQVFGVLILGFSAYYGYLAFEIWTRDHAEGVGERPSEVSGDGWINSLEQGLRKAQKNRQKVLVDVWATWCKNCYTMDKTTLRDPDVLEALEDYVKIKYQAEDINVSPAKDVIARFHGIGLPLYAILAPKPVDGAPAVDPE